MCTYNTKRAFRAISHSLLKSILASKAPDMRIPWNRVTQRKIEPLYAEFLKLDDGLRAEIDSVLYEICSVADCPANATTLHVQIQQHGLVPPEDFAEWSIHDKAAWVCLNSDSAWTQAVRFSQADRISEKLWFLQKLVNGGAGQLKYEDDRFERLKLEITSYIYQEEGRGKYSYIEYFERIDQGKEYFFVYLSDYPRSSVQWRGGSYFERDLDKTAYEIVFVYDWKENILSLRTTGDRSHKVRLCKIWANVMRDTVISDAEEDEHMFNLSVFRNGPANLPVDPLSDVREAKIILIETDMDGKRGTRRVFQENDRDVFQQMRAELKPDAYATSLERFTTVKIRMHLDPKKYGRSKVQTVTVRLDHCDINSKNPNVQELIMSSLKGWRACA